MMRVMLIIAFMSYMRRMTASIVVISCAGASVYCVSVTGTCGTLWTSTWKMTTLSSTFTLASVVPTSPMCLG